jgi:hypothetical protein
MHSDAARQDEFPAFRAPLAGLMDAEVISAHDAQPASDAALAAAKQKPSPEQDDGGRSGEDENKQTVRYDRNSIEPMTNGCLNHKWRHG